MAYISYLDRESELFKEVAPGFFIQEIETGVSSMSVVQLKLERRYWRRYPKEGFAKLKTDMMVTVTEGSVRYCQSSDSGRYRLLNGDAVIIPKDTEYWWELEDEEYVVLLAVNSPPFDPQDRKV